MEWAFFHCGHRNGAALLTEIAVTETVISTDTWIGRLKAGDSGAAERLWRHYHRQLVKVACQRLNGSAKIVADEEDVVVSAFNSFFRALRENRTPRLQSDDEIWRLLVTLTARKAIKQIRYESRYKRQGNRQQYDGEVPTVDDILSTEPSAEFVVAVAEEYRKLNDHLVDDEMRLIALRKMEGYSSAEIAQELNTNLRTVQRRIAVIRSLLLDALDEMRT